MTVATTTAATTTIRRFVAVGAALLRLRQPSGVDGCGRPLRPVVRGHGTGRMFSTYRARTGGPVIARPSAGVLL
ncbi:hypothetical protein GCM10009675_08100 [Prauserella alba]|uniref:Uncharacterized protein n=1 Tax=Prauserella alba TaxID=176898 RepID=A0ABN1V595_9PSEU